MSAPGPWLATASTRTLILNGTLQSGDTYNCALFQSTSNLGPTSTTYALLTDEVANGNGYATGGVPVVMSLSGTTVVSETFVSPPSWTGTGAGFAARYAVVYEVGGSILCYCLLDSAPADYVLAPGNTMAIVPNVAGVLVQS